MPKSKKAPKKPYQKKTFLITAGPTIEPIDPVRYISNYSTGEMGYELAKAAKKKGHKVILISGPTSLKRPKGVKFIPVITALDMKRAVSEYFRSADCVIMTAAVADFRPAVFSGKKLKKTSKKEYILRLVRNPDILSELGGVCRRQGKSRKIIVGYSLDTDNHIANAKRKMTSKHLDIIVVNRAGKTAHPFGSGKKDVTIISKEGATLVLKGTSKQKISHILLDKIDILA
ncbi:MAG: phosphopantothenoylcysteine decarboxylase [Candidatus Omnitrophica bacterium]|nr:phosphopantothenoylcysteine decarboxylase [Candidatus Omnitrophota bacterium]